MKKSFLQKLSSPSVRKIFRENHLDAVYITGSFARGEERETSDIDLIYRKQEHAKFTLFNIGNIKYRLEGYFGREVDLVSEKTIRPEIRDRLEKDRICIFSNGENE